MSVVNIISVNCTPAELDAELTAIITVLRPSVETLQFMQVFLDNVLVNHTEPNPPVFDPASNTWLHTFNLSQMVMCSQNYDIRAEANIVVTKTNTAIPANVACGACSGGPMP